MKVMDVEEQEDGSAIFRMEFTTEEVELLCEKAFVDILKESLPDPIKREATDED